MTTSKGPSGPQGGAPFFGPEGPGAGPRTPRARRRRRPLRLAVTVVTVLAVATTGVVLALNRLDDHSPVAERCAATADGQAWHLSPAQSDNAALIAVTTVRRGMPARAATIGLATALQESRLLNIDYGDRDSIGLFQQRPSQGWGTIEQIMDPVYSTTAFYDGLDKVDGYTELPVTVAAQAVQRSGFPDAYAQHESRSRAWASALTGNSHGTLTCDLAPVDPSTLTTTEESVAGLEARVQRDLGDLPTSVDGAAVTVDSLPLAGNPPETGRAGWAVAQWAVASADATDVVQVDVGDRTWSRESPEWAVSEPTDEAPHPGTGQVRITVATTDEP
ncbi:hypothetical protein H9640_00565 [Oerskovia sp. Sa2CUA8]|uniref:Heavy metal transporter n=1 Tax=Oerskovia gallyi TaxID=2762226 RepID=A0ABR8UWX1_9CELL|nr:hypothetical protein [Oerskovia gallyi]MBD7997046.1 hypothetical protein [Oerskovia gallyi]